MKTIEDRLAELAAHTAPEDLQDGTGRRRTLEERLQIAQARAGIHSPESPTTAPAAPAPQDTSALASLLDAEQTRTRGALAQVAELRTQLDSSRQEALTLRQSNADLQRRLDGYSAEGEVGRLTSELTSARASLSRASANVERLEGYCQLRGVSAANAVPAIAEQLAGSNVYDTWQRLKKEQPERSLAYYRAHEKELRQYATTVAIQESNNH